MTIRIWQLMASALIFVFLFAAVMSEADCVAELMKMYQKLTEEKTSNLTKF